MSEYLAWLKGNACAACKAPPPCDAAHLSGVASLKTGLPMPRRKAHAFYWAIPLCKECHQTGKASIHALGEAAFFRAFNRGDDYGHRLAGAYLAVYLSKLEGRP